MAALNLAGKTVVVTGGASGIGLAIVRFFASHSTKVAILDISAASAQAAVSSLRAEFPSTTFIFKECDVSNWENQKEAFKQLYKETGSVDFVFANAGIADATNFLGSGDGEPEKPSMKTIDINLVGNLYTINLAAHYMRKNTSARKGLIVCTASAAGLYPFAASPMYGISKHGVVGAVRSFAKPLELDGIQINGLCPNVVATSIADENLFSNMILTPMSVVVDAVRELVSKPQITGMTVEISGDKFTLRGPPEYGDDILRKNTEMFWTLRSSNLKGLASSS